MKSQKSALHVETTEQDSNIDYHKLHELVVKYNTQNKSVSNAKENDAYIGKLSNSDAFLNSEVKQTLSDKIRNALKTLTIYPSSSAEDYLKYTSLNESSSKAIAHDWAKIGNQIWLSFINSRNNYFDGK